MINLFAEVDIAVVCEEVVEGVFAGHGMNCRSHFATSTYHI